MGNSRRNQNESLEGIINMLIEFGRGNFDFREEVTDSDDELNTVTSGLNMLGEELAFYKKELSDKNDFLENILSSIDEVVYARTIDHTNPALSPFTFISARCNEILGITPETLTKQPDAWIRSIHPDDNRNTADVIMNIISGQDEVFTYRIYHPGKGKYIWLEDRVVSKKDKDGIAIALYGTARDITEQKNVAVDLTEKNELISRLITTSDQFFYIAKLDPANSFKAHFTYVSWQIEEVQGSKVADLKDKDLDWLTIIHPDDIEQVKADNRKMFSTGEPVMRSYRARHAVTGKYMWLEDYVIPVNDGEGHISELFGSVRNVHKRKTAELEREHLNRELHNRYNESMQFNYIVSHNLRAPVANILGLSQLLMGDATEQERETARKYIHEAASDMDELLNDLNNILSSRSLLNDKVEPTLISDTVTSVAKNLKMQIDNTGTTIHTDIAPSADKLISIRSYIKSILFNLISNAIKYRHAERKPVITVTARLRNGQHIISVADNGMGIDLERNADKIFGLYSRLDDTREGKGLGLYMVKTQTEALGGTIDVESTPGKGTTFTVTI